MLIIDTIGYRRFKITPDPIELEKNPNLKVLIFEAEPYIMAKGDLIKLEFHLYQQLETPVKNQEITSGGMGSQDNIGTPGIFPLNHNNTEIPTNQPDMEMVHHHKTILEYNLNYMDIQLNGFKDWLSLDACILALYDGLKPISTDNFLISGVIKNQSDFIRKDTIETRIFTPKLYVSSEYADHFDFIYSKAQGVCHRNQNMVFVFIEIEATLNLLVSNPDYHPADIIRIGDLPYRASSILDQTFCSKSYIGYTPVAHTLHSIIEAGANTIQLVKSTNIAPGIKEARWGLDIPSDRIKFIINTNYLID